MNMTVVIISKRSMEFVAGCVLLVLLATATASKGQQDLPEEFETVRDERHQLNDEQLGSIVRDFGVHLQDTMEDEMKKLVSEVQTKLSEAEARKQHPHNEVSAGELERLKQASHEASQDIKTRVKMAGDNDGNLPQMGLGSVATSFAAAASGRLSAAGSYIGNKMRSLGNSLKKKVPARLRRFFKWPTFLRFKIRFHKVYKSLREELYRQMIFLRSHIVVGMQHVRYLLGRDKFLTGQNQYSDWTEKEYFAREGNHEAERGPADLDPSARRGLDAADKRKLEELAKNGQNIFGKPIGKPIEMRRKKRNATKRDGEELEREEARGEQAQEGELNQAKRHRRTRRDVDSDGDEDMYDANELDESEDDFEAMELDNELDSDSEANAEDAFKLVDEFVQDIDLDALDDIDSNIDEALDANTNLVPIDLRQTGCMINPENQNGCGCCYSHVLNAWASYFNCMESEPHSPVRYHARFLSDCGKYMTPQDQYPAVNGCRGGRISKGYLFAQKVGLQRFAHYNLAQVSAQVFDDTCAYPRPKSENIAEHGWRAFIEPVHMYKRSEFTLVKKEEVDLHLRTIGPVPVNVRTWKNFKDYAAGIVDKLEDADMSELHSMLIVGHDKDARGRDYWIILNSHGIVWGERGYLRVYTDVLEDYAVLYGGLKPSQF